MMFKEDAGDRDSVIIIATEKDTEKMVRYSLKTNTLLDGKVVSLGEFGFDESPDWTLEDVKSSLSHKVSHYIVEA